MNVSSIGSSPGTMGINGTGQQDFRARMQQSMAPVAQLFNMTSDQLMAAVRNSGGSLADYAASKGISNADLSTAIKQGLQENAPNGVQLSDSQLTNMVQRIEDHKPGDGPQGPPPSATTNAVGVTGTGVSSADLKTDLEKLIADLKAVESSTASAGTTSGTDTSSDTLVQILSQIDAQL